MAVALRAKVRIASLVSVDNAPVDAALKSDFGKYIQGMRKIIDANVQKQSEADAILAEYESNVGVRQFLLTNLARGKDGIQRFRIPVKYLANALDNMADFPFTDPEEARWEGPALFVRGTKSHYVADETLPIIGRFFPRFEVADVDSGHWVISEKPQEFRDGMLKRPLRVRHGLTNVDSRRRVLAGQGVDLACRYQSCLGNRMDRSKSLENSCLRKV
jgi:pimeloyl-ACP methyl ester carboxylesterase